MLRLPILLPVVVVFSLVMLGCWSSDSSASVKANEEAYVEAFFAQDLDAFMDTFTDDAVFIDETYGDHLEGKAAVRSMYANVIGFADPDQSELIDGFVADGAILGFNQQRDQQRRSPAHDIEHIRTDESLQFRAKRFYH